MIGDPTSLDSTYAPALAFGAPDPSAPNTDPNNFIYVGTVSGNIYVSTTGGNVWTQIDNGLALTAGALSPVMQISPIPPGGVATPMPSPRTGSTTSASLRCVGRLCKSAHTTISYVDP